MPIPTTSDTAPQLLDPRFAQAMRDMYEWWRKRKEYPRPLYRPDDRLWTPEVFVAFTPPGGLPALAYTAAGDASLQGLPVTHHRIVPGRAECTLYRLLEDTGDASLPGYLQGMPLGITQQVYNLGERIAGNTPFLAVRDKGGAWWACCPGRVEISTGTGTGSSGTGTGTGTGTSSGVNSIGQGAVAVGETGGGGFGINTWDASLTALDVQAGSVLIIYTAVYGTNPVDQAGVSVNGLPAGFFLSQSRNGPLGCKLLAHYWNNYIAGDLAVVAHFSASDLGDAVGHLILVEVQGLPVPLGPDRTATASGALSAPDTGATAASAVVKEYAGSAFALMDAAPQTYGYAGGYSNGGQDLHSTVQGVECYTTEGFLIANALQAFQSTLTGTTPAGWAALLASWK